MIPLPIKKQTGSTLAVLLICLTITSLLSISLFTNSLQTTTNTRDFFARRQQFYSTEACLWRNKRSITALTEPLPTKANCHNQRCVNPYQFNLALAEQATPWWKTHGIACGAQVWQYRELLWQQHDAAIYRISVYHQQHLLLQLYVDKHFAAIQDDDFSWRQIY